jgi:UDP-glucose 4-epimerase
MIQHHHSQLQPPGRVVVLGGRGFLGTALVRRLENAVPLGSAEVNLLEPSSVDKLRGIVREGDALVIGATLTPDKGKDARTAMKNLTMGEHVAAVIEAVKFAHIIYISSDAVYEDEANPVRETSCASPTTLYGLMHLMRERMVLVAAQKSAAPVMLLRPCTMYGAGDTHNSYGPNRFLRTALKDRQIALFGQGEEQRDHLYIHDCARLIEECLRHRTAGLLNVATGKAVSFMEVAQTVAGIVGGEVAIKGQSRSGPVTHRHFDITEILKTYPSFRFTPLRDGLAEAAKQMQ